VSPGELSRVPRPASFAGAGLLPLLILSAILGGCGESGDGVPDGTSESVQALGLPAGAQLHQITLGGRGAEEHVVPTRIEASPGDAVEFRTVDHRVHNVSFIADSLTLEVHAFLESTGQMASPPLVSRGSRFILRLQNAPSGRYLFRSEGHGGVALGVVQVGFQPQAGAVQNPRR
jgi:plastocyanin